MENKRIQWHPGFVAAMNLELAQNRKAKPTALCRNFSTHGIKISNPYTGVYGIVFFSICYWINSRKVRMKK